MYQAESDPICHHNSLLALASINIVQLLHDGVQLLQLSVFTLSQQLQGGDELGDGAAQVDQQLGDAALILLLWFKLRG